MDKTLSAERDKSLGRCPVRTVKNAKDVYNKPNLCQLTLVLYTESKPLLVKKLGVGEMDKVESRQYMEYFLIFFRAMTSCCGQAN